MAWVRLAMEHGAGSQGKRRFRARVSLGRGQCAQRVGKTTGSTGNTDAWKRLQVGHVGGLDPILKVQEM